MPPIKQVWQFIQYGDYAFSIVLKDAYLHVPIIKSIIIVCDLFCRINLISEVFVTWTWYSPKAFSFPYLSNIIPLSSQ